MKILHLKYPIFKSNLKNGDLLFGVGKRKLKSHEVKETDKYIYDLYQIASRQPLDNK